MSLRKISNHPILENAKYKDDSGKFTDVIEQLESLQKANHKILLFSSFTSHLDLYQSYFEKVEWKYAISGGRKDFEYFFGELFDIKDVTLTKGMNFSDFEVVPATMNPNGTLKEKGKITIKK